MSSVAGPGATGRWKTRVTVSRSSSVSTCAGSTVLPACSRAARRISSSAACRTMRRVAFSTRTSTDSLPSKVKRSRSGSSVMR